MNLSDFDRPLNTRGKINARFMSEKFANEESVDLIISSPAKRAISTAEYYAKALDTDVTEIRQEKLIYESIISELLELVNTLDDSLESVILFGHNPTFSSFASYLDDSFYTDLVTCARVKICFDVDSWSEISADLGTVEHHIYPRMYPEMADL